MYVGDRKVVYLSIGVLLYAVGSYGRDWDKNGGLKSMT